MCQPYGGNDILDGGDGRDVAYYRGNSADYRIDIVDGAYQVTDLRDGSPDGTDLLVGIESLNFADRNMALAPLSTQLTATIDFQTLGDAVIAAQAFQHDPDLVFCRKVPPRPATDVLHHPFGGLFGV